MVASLTYFQYALNIATKYFVRLDINPKLMNDVMARIRLPLPPADEQMKIVAHLGAALASIRILRERMESAITLLREHRSALIAASVTGQIDVGTYRAARARVSA
jgi:type I restriction enzyme S subunit